MRLLRAAFLAAILTGVSSAAILPGRLGLGFFAQPGGGGVTTVFDYSGGFTSGVQSQFTGTGNSANTPLFTGTALNAVNGQAGNHEAGSGWYNVAKENIQAFTTDFTFKIGYQSVSGESYGTGNGTVGPYTYTPTYGAVPGTITVTAGAISGTDNGSGVISGTGISGTVDYLSRKISVTFSSALTTGTAITVSYSAPATGMTFVIQNDPRDFTASADANGMGYTAYSSNPAGTAIANSIGLIFNATQNNIGGPYVVGKTPSMVGLYVDGGPYDDNGVFPIQDASPQGIDFYSGHTFSAHVVYDGSILSLDLTDTTTSAHAHFDWPINIPSMVGANTARIGFGGGTLAAGALQVLGWKWEEGTNSRLSVPTFSPSPGQYTASQSVTLSATPGSTIYYTTDGSIPTVGSSVYSSALTVSSNEVIKAIAVESGYENSLPSIGGYEIQSSGTPTINFPSGFSSAASLLMIAGQASISGSVLGLAGTGGSSNTEVGLIGSAFYAAPVPIGTFSTTYTFSFSTLGTGALHNGLSFIITSPGLNLYSAAPVTYSSVGGGPYSLGQGVSGSKTGFGSLGIGPGVAVVYDVWDNEVGISINGGAPTFTAITGITLGVNSVSNTLTYNGTTLSLTMQDTTTLATFSPPAWTVNIPSELGGATSAYVGFAGGTYDTGRYPEITAWTM